MTDIERDYTFSPRALEFYRRMDVPPPKLSAVERLRGRFAFRHGGNLHRVRCPGTGKDIISMYSAEREYFELRERIVAHMRRSSEWGSFFPGVISPFAYNESVAALYLPLERREAEERGYYWASDEDNGSPEGPPSEFVLPENTADVGDDILQRSLHCQMSGRPYRITPQELAFYRRMELPLPRLCPTERHRRRLLQRHSFQLYRRTCAVTGSEVLTALPEGNFAKVATTAGPN